MCPRLDLDAGEEAGGAVVCVCDTRSVLRARAHAMCVRCARAALSCELGEEFSLGLRPHACSQMSRGRMSTCSSAYVDALKTRTSVASPASLSLSPRLCLLFSSLVRPSSSSSSSLSRARLAKQSSWRPFSDLSTCRSKDLMPSPFSAAAHRLRWIRRR